MRGVINNVKSEVIFGHFAVQARQSRGWSFSHNKIDLGKSRNLRNFTNIKLLQRSRAVKSQHIIWLIQCSRATCAVCWKLRHCVAVAQPGFNRWSFILHNYAQLAKLNENCTDAAQSRNQVSTYYTIVLAQSRNLCSFMKYAPLRRSRAVKSRHIIWLHHLRSIKNVAPQWRINETEI